MQTRYIIVQAGGKGTRLKHLTRNRPKALVPVDNLPILYHLFRTFPQAKFIIISDYKRLVMRHYLAAFPEVEYLLVDTNETGTCAGVHDAIALIPKEAPFMLIWSDLILPRDISIPDDIDKRNYIGLSQDFSCRWSYHDRTFEEVPSETDGVAGLFLFCNTSLLDKVPSSGEFVKWLQTACISFDRLTLRKTKEYGLLETISTPQGGRCRPFNKMTKSPDRITKEGIDDQGRQLAVREKSWYKHVDKLGFHDTPAIFSYEPSFVMERINGKNVFEYSFNQLEKETVLEQIVNILRNLHSLETGPVDRFSLKKAYFTKTMERLDKIRDLVPFADQPFITINGKKCRNVFFHRDELEFALEALPCAKFCLIHGDCTFSNIILRDASTPVLIDPRGYFGNTELLGDPLYDWSKLYYSLYGNYDQFNLRRFDLVIDETEVFLSIESNGWEATRSQFFELVADEATRSSIELVHAIIWLSLTTYAWEDYDSICGSFYNGLLYLEEIL